MTNKRRYKKLLNRGEKIEWSDQLDCWIWWPNLFFTYQRWSEKVFELQDEILRDIMDAPRSQKEFDRLYNGTWEPQQSLRSENEKLKVYEIMAGG